MEELGLTLWGNGREGRLKNPKKIEGDKKSVEDRGVECIGERRVTFALTLG
jgi:hypothetical protein